MSEIQNLIKEYFYEAVQAMPPELELTELEIHIPGFNGNVVVYRCRVRQALE